MTKIIPVRTRHIAWPLAGYINPLDQSMKTMIENIMKSGSTISVCPPCAKVRGYSETDLLPGVKIVGSIAVHEQILAGAAALSF